jgi:hypothetical protein
MDVASRFPIRARTGSHRDAEGQAMPEDSGGECMQHLSTLSMEERRADLHS